MTGEFATSDEGKRVVTADKDVIGAIVRVEDDVVYVRPNSDVIGRCGSWITETKTKSEVFALDTDTIEEVTETEIKLEQQPPRLMDGQ